MIRTDCLHGLAWGSWSRDLAPGGPRCRKVKQTTASQPKQFQAAVSYENGPQNGIGDPVPPHLLRSSAPHAVDVVVLACARVGGMLEAVKTRMKTLFAALALATLIAGPAFVTSADAARWSVPEYDQPRANRDSDGSWQCYPYCAGGTYEGRPVREWLKPDGW